MCLAVVWYIYINFYIYLIYLYIFFSRVWYDFVHMWWKYVAQIEDEIGSSTSWPLPLSTQGAVLRWKIVPADLLLKIGCST